MKKISIAIISILLFVTGFAFQPDTISFINNENDLHRLVQLKNSNETVKKYFLEKGIGSKSDFLVAIILPPMGCPRCEGLINPFLNDVEESDSSITTAVFTFYPKTKPAFNYLKQRRFQADDHYIFTSKEFLDNFYISSNGLQVPYFAKFNVRTGDLLLSKSALGMSYDRSIADDFVKADKPMKKYEGRFVTSSLDETKITNLSFDVDSLAVSGNDFLEEYTIYRVKEDNDFVLSEIKRIEFSGDGQHITFMDDLTNSICVYERIGQEYEFLRNFHAGEFENRLFISEDIDENLYLFLKKMNILNSMYFSSGLFGDTVIISASLPHVFIEDKEAEEIAYMNKAVFLLKDIKNTDLDSYIVIDTNFTDIVIDHIDASFFPEQNLIAIPTSKGWPVSGTKALPEINSEDNPFNDDFYSFTPAFALFDMRGKFRRFLGSIDPIYQKYMVGYSFFSPKINYYENSFWIADSYAGKIIKYPNKIQSQHLEEYDIFIHPINIDNLINEQKGTIDYIKSFNNIFHDYINDFTITGNELLLLVKSGDDDIIISYNRNERSITNKKIVPQVINGCTCKSLKFFNMGGSISIRGVYESDTSSLIIQFPVN